MDKANEILSLKGKDVWVIGGAGYLGQATVQLLLNAGAKVLCADLEERAQEYAKSLGDDSLTGDGLDVRNSEAIKQFVTKYAAERGAPQGLVVLTFGSTSKRFDDLTEEDFDNVNHVGLTSTFLLAREVGNLMAEAGGGSIVLFSSMYGSVSPNPAVYGSPMNPNPIEYGVGKAGIVQMTRYLAVHYGQRGVRCNCLSPGPFPSPQVKQNNPGFVDRLSEKVPMGRVGEQGEIAGAVAFFVSDASSFITGQNLFVDGGWTAW
jgi:NAD(P)-dependent dehydrogenase (short-subunit alcohol dehydrogenase family)